VRGHEAEDARPERSHRVVAVLRAVWRGLGLAAVVAMAFASIPSAAVATPDIGYTALSEPGATLGAGTTSYNEISVTGSEYFGDPDPLTGLTLRLPSGSTISASGFPTCSEEVLIDQGPYACPGGSQAGALGSFTASVFLGGSPVEETGLVYAFFAPGGGLDLAVNGFVPVAVEAVVSGTYLPPSGGFGPGWRFKLPLLESVPGAPYMSFTYLSFPDAWFRRTEEGTKASLTLPSACSSGWSFNAEITVTEPVHGNEETVARESPFGCPYHSSRIATETVAAAPSYEVLEGGAAHFTATTTSHETLGAPLGGAEVTFEDDGRPIPQCEHLQAVTDGASAVAECEVKGWFAEPHSSITAVYYNDQEYAPSVSRPLGVVTVTEEEAAARRKAEQEAVAKHKAEQETAAKRNAEEEAAAKHKAEEVAAASDVASSIAAKPTVRFARFKLHATSVSVTVTCSSAGRLTITGLGLKGIGKACTAGTHAITVALTKRGLAERRQRRRVKLTITLTVSGASSSITEVVRL
jgi:hypothetical protein